MIDVIITALGLLGGLAVFIYGMNEMNGAIQRAAGNKLERILSNMSDKRIKGILLGFAVTAIVQSSSATTVMVVGLVNSGMLTLAQATSIIIGANIGTTVTSWIISISGLEGSGGASFLSLLKSDSLGFMLCLVGIIMMMFLKNRKKKQIGSLLMSLGLIFVGLELMGQAMDPLSENPAFQQALTFFTNPFLSFFIGLAVCCIVQSSSASVGMLQSLAMTSGALTGDLQITFGLAVPLILGMHVGTCITALLSSIGTSVNARRSALVHLYFNVINSLFLLIVFVVGTKFIFTDVADIRIKASYVIPTIHTSTSIIGALLMLPFMRQLTKLAEISVKEKPNEDLKDLPDEKFLGSTVVALTQSRKALHKMANLARECILDSLEQLKEYSPQRAQEIEKKEGLIDTYEDKVGSYLVKLCESNLGAQESREATKFLHMIGDFERISDHALNIQGSAEEIFEEKVEFSEKAKIELDTICEALREMVDLTVTSFLNEDTELATHAEPLEEIIDRLKALILNNHINRIQTGECTIKNGFVLNDLLTNLERVSDHCSNVAACSLRAAQDFEFHEYINQIKDEENTAYTDMVRTYEEKYMQRV